MYYISFFKSYIRDVFKMYREFCVFSKIIYLCMKIYFVPFKVIPTRYYTLVPTIFFQILEALQKFIFCDLVQLLLQCRLYLLNRSVASSFPGPLQFRKQEKVTGARSGEYGGCGITSALFLTKNSRTSFGRY